MNVPALQSLPEQETVPTSARRSGIPRLVWFAGLFLFSYAVVLARLGEQWLTNDDMSHGIFVPFLVGYIVWHRRDALLNVIAKPNLWGLSLLLVGAVMLCIGPPSLPTFAFVTRSALICSLFGILLYLRGSETVRLLAYPLLLCFFMIPLPSFVYDRVTLPLQFVASGLAEQALEGLGYSVLREGNILHLPRQTLSVVEACSGLRSLLSLSFLGQAYAYLFDQRPWMRAALAVAIVPIAVLANAGRIVFTAVIGDYNQKWAHGIFHDSAGWVVFVIAFGCLLLVHRLINKVSRSRRPEDNHAPVS